MPETVVEPLLGVGSLPKGDEMEDLDIVQLPGSIDETLDQIPGFAASRSEKHLRPSLHRPECILEGGDFLGVCRLPFLRH